VRKIYLRLLIVIISSFSAIATAEEDTCQGEGKYEFGNKSSGRLGDETSPFIRGNPEGTCDVSSKEVNNIVNDIWKNASGTGNASIAIFSMGAPGCGKSSSMASVINGLGFSKNQFVNIDPDDIRARMKPFRDALSVPSTLCPQKKRAFTGATGWCKGPSGKITGKLLSRALEEGKSFILDGTCSNKGYCRKIMEQAKNAGFSVHLVAVYANKKVCTERATGRALHNGRWASPQYVAEVFDKLRSSQGFKELSEIAAESGGDAWIFDNSGNEVRKIFQKKSQCNATESRTACGFYGM
jgi:predicted ABC-type ATPase